MWNKSKCDVTSGMKGSWRAGLPTLENLHRSAFPHSSPPVSALTASVTVATSIFIPVSRQGVVSHQGVVSRQGVVSQDCCRLYRSKVAWAGQADVESLRLNGTSSGERGFCLSRSEVIKNREEGPLMFLLPRHWEGGASSSLSWSNWVIS